jgi:hypothetical protein
MELAGISRLCQILFFNGYLCGEGALNKLPGSLGGILSSFPLHPLVIIKVEAIRSRIIL